ncbi:MAG: VOC family protein [Dehalococcoidia bacterium]
MAGLVYAMPMVITFVSDMDRAMKFYTEVLGLHAGMATEHFSVLNLPGGMTMALHSGGKEREHGVANCVPVFSIENVKKAKEQLEAQGVPVVDGPSEIPGGIQFEVTDPDGNLIQLMQRTI